MPESIQIHDNMLIRWKHEGLYYCLHFQNDAGATDFFEDDCSDAVVKLVCWHGRHPLGTPGAAGKDSPDEFWQRLVRENVTNEEFVQAVREGRIGGIRIAGNPEDKALVDVYAMTVVRTVLGTSEPSEELILEQIRPDDVLEHVGDELTIGHCQELLKDKFAWLPLWLYEHSGLTISCGERVYPFNDQFDSSPVGWGIAKLSDIPAVFPCETGCDWRAKAEGLIRSLVTSYDQYLTGDIWWFRLLSSPTGAGGSDDSWDEIDSCGNFYGSDLMANGMLGHIGCGFREAVESGALTVGQMNVTHPAVYALDIEAPDDGPADGPADNGEKPCIRIRTPAGTIVAYPGIDPCNPGIYIDLERDGVPFTMNLAVVECQAGEPGEQKEPVVMTHVWGDGLQEDPTVQETHRNIGSYFNGGTRE